MGLSEHKAYLGASPDAKFSCKCHEEVVVELKCPMTYKDTAPNANSLSYLYESPGGVKFKQNHAYYTVSGTDGSDRVEDFLGRLLENIRTRFPRTDLLDAMKVFEPAAYPQPGDNQALAYWSWHRSVGLRRPRLIFMFEFGRCLNPTERFGTTMPSKRPRGMSTCATATWKDVCESQFVAFKQMVSARLRGEERENDDGQVYFHHYRPTELPLVATMWRTSRSMVNMFPPELLTGKLKAQIDGEDASQVAGTSQSSSSEDASQVAGTSQSSSSEDASQVAGTSQPSSSEDASQLADTSQPSSSEDASQVADTSQPSSSNGHSSQAASAQAPAICPTCAKPCLDNFKSFSDGSEGCDVCDRFLDKIDDEDKMAVLQRLIDGELECGFDKKAFNRRKIDQFREGQWSCIVQTDNTSCPVAILRHFLRASQSTGHVKLFRRVANIRGLDARKYGLHSLRSGGASTAAAMGVPDRLIAHHGGWRSTEAREGYILESKSSVLGPAIRSPVSLCAMSSTCSCLRSSQRRKPEKPSTIKHSLSFPGLYGARGRSRRGRGGQAYTRGRQPPSCEDMEIQFYLLEKDLEKTPLPTEEGGYVAAGLGPQTVAIKRTMDHKQVELNLFEAYPRLRELEGGWLLKKAVGSGSKARPLVFAAASQAGYPGEWFWQNCMEGKIGETLHCADVVGTVDGTPPCNSSVDLLYSVLDTRQDYPDPYVGEARVVSDSRTDLGTEWDKALLDLCPELCPVRHGSGQSPRVPDRISCSAQGSPHLTLPNQIGSSTPVAGEGNTVHMEGTPYTWRGPCTHRGDPVHMEGTLYTWRGPGTHGGDPVHMEGTRYSWRGPCTHRGHPVHMEGTLYTRRGTRYSWRGPCTHRGHPVHMERDPVHMEGDRVHMEGDPVHMEGDSHMEGTLYSWRGTQC
ncbi:hypothetical protein Bbelb_317710 [Branchiostoma belcheri]|nr:hypothetical protein Bbelb_317710 [Branchiostoma belcheri]